MLVGCTVVDVQWLCNLIGRLINRHGNSRFSYLDWFSLSFQSVFCIKAQKLPEIEYGSVTVVTVTIATLTSHRYSGRSLSVALLVVLCV